MQVLCIPGLLVLLGYLIDSGDGQWERLRLSQIKRDVSLLEKIADNLQHEIEGLYTERHHKRKHKPRRLRKHRTQTNATVETEVNDAPPKSADIAETEMPDAKSSPARKPISDARWPKFEEILSMNRRRYDWKSDRWIKLDVPTRRESAKHRFSYSRVRLEGKTRRNVVAVSAVR